MSFMPWRPAAVAFVCGLLYDERARGEALVQRRRGDRALERRRDGRLACAAFAGQREGIAHLLSPAEGNLDMSVWGRNSAEVNAS